MALSPARVAAIVAGVLDRVRRATKIVVRVHPDDASVLRQVQERARERAIFRVEEDSDISRGGCLVQTDLGQIDARVETRLGELADALEKAGQAE